VRSTGYRFPAWIGLTEREVFRDNYGLVPVPPNRNQTYPREFLNVSLRTLVVMALGAPPAL
jgi:hypothetical protein